MKFAKELLQTALPEWRVFFISYKRLKRVLKTLIEQGKTAGDDLPFWTALGEELSRVKRFYEAKYSWAEQKVTVLEENVERLELAAASQRKQKREDSGHGDDGSKKVKGRNGREGKEDEDDDDEERGSGRGTLNENSSIQPHSVQPPVVERISSFSSSSERPPRPPPLSSPSLLVTSPITTKLSSPLQSSLLALHSTSSPPLNENSTTPSALVSSTWSDFSPADRSRTASSFDSDIELPSLLASPDRPAGTSPSLLLSFSASALSSTNNNSSSILTSPALLSNEFQSPILMVQGDIAIKRSSDLSNPKYGMSLVRTISKESQSSAHSNSLLLRAGSPFSSIVSDDERLTPNFLFPSMRRDEEGGDVDDNENVQDDDDNEDVDVDREIKNGVRFETDISNNEDINDTNDSGSVLTTGSTQPISSSSSVGLIAGGIRNKGEATSEMNMSEKMMRTRYKHFFRVDQVEQARGLLVASESNVIETSTKDSENSPSKATEKEKSLTENVDHLNTITEAAHNSKESDSKSSFEHADLLEKSVVEDAEPTLPHVEYAAIRKRVHDLGAELSLLSEYCRLNDTAVYKIVKKHDKLFSSTTLAQYLTKLHDDSSPFSFLVGAAVKALVVRAETLTKRVRQLEPEHAAWSRMKVVTVGTFDVAHHGHVNLLRSMRAFGKTTIVGIHDDVSYALLKGKPPEEPLEKRMSAIRDHCDVIFVIPSTDPTPYLAASLLPADVEKKRVVYVRGEDMAEFPGRKWVESKKIPIYLLPRTESVSSTLIKAVSAVALTGISSPGGSSSPTSSLQIRDRQLDVALGKLSFTT